MKYIFILLMFFCGGAWAGAKGLDVLLINIGDADFFDREVYIEYSNYFENDEQGDCWNSYGDRMSGLYRITKKKLPLGINTEIAKNIWNGSGDVISAARSIMHKKDGDHTTSDGYHGMYIIKPEGNKLTLMGLGANEDRKKGLSGISEKITITLDEKDPKKAARQFEQALCKVSKPFNIGFSL